MTEKFFPAGVVASEQRTTYDHILDSETSMPEPEGEFEWNAAKNEWVMGKGTWKFYPHAKGKAATK